jgi:hypothetical protein
VSKSVFEINKRVPWRPLPIIICCGIFAAAIGYYGLKGTSSSRSAKRFARCRGQLATVEASRTELLTHEFLRAASSRCCTQCRIVTFESEFCLIL